MSNEEDRKSMDDVLASIRRIVRSEKDPEAQASPGPGGDAAPAAPSPDNSISDSLAAQAGAAQNAAPQSAFDAPAAPGPADTPAPSPAEPATTAARAAEGGYDAAREPTLVPSAGLNPAPQPVAPEASGPETSGSSDRGAEEEGDAPLALTSEMRLDESEQNEGSALAQAMDAVASDSTAESLVPDGNDVAAGLGAAAAAAASGATLPDPEQLKDMVRSVILEELNSSDTAGEAIRAILRDELMSGEIGQNISQNVLALIQAEVAKATGS